MSNSLLDVFDFLSSSPKLFFSVSDIMRGVPCSWVTARDSLVVLMAKGWVSRKKQKGYKLYSANVIVVVVKKS